MNKLLFKSQSIEIEVLDMKRNFDKFLDLSVHFYPGSLNMKEELLVKVAAIELRPGLLLI